MQEGNQIASPLNLVQKLHKWECFALAASWGMSAPLVSHRYATEDGTEQLFYRTASQAMYLSPNQSLYNKVLLFMIKKSDIWADLGCLGILKSINFD